MGAIPHGATVSKPCSVKRSVRLGPSRTFRTSTTGEKVNHPDTLLRWHRRRVDRHWTQPQRPPGPHDLMTTPARASESRARGRRRASGSPPRRRDLGGARRTLNSSLFGEVQGTSTVRRSPRSTHRVPMTGTLPMHRVGGSSSSATSGSSTTMTGSPQGGPTSAIRVLPRLGGDSGRHCCVDRSTGAARRVSGPGGRIR